MTHDSGIQPTLFGGLAREPDKPYRDEVLEILITVKAAPNPSVKSGETVCVAGLALHAGRTDSSWIRLYPINFRFLDADLRFRKYDIVRVKVTPAGGDPRRESWRPDMSTMTVLDHLRAWQPRRALLDPVAVDTMCGLFAANQHGATGPSLGLVPVREVKGLDLTAHPGWTQEERGKIDAYVSQLDLFSDSDKSPLEAPRFTGHYRWLCPQPSCPGHRQSIIDWEFVALQRRYRGHSDAEVQKVLRHNFLEVMFAPGRQVAFFVGNQAKRHHVFHVLGVYYPN